MPIVSVNTVSLIGTFQEPPRLEDGVIMFTLILMDPDQHSDAVPCRAALTFTPSVCGANTGERVMVCGKLRSRDHSPLHVWVTDITKLYS